MAAGLAADEGFQREVSFGRLARSNGTAIGAVMRAALLDMAIIAGVGVVVLRQVHAP